jgi:hypothetical protein
MPLGRGDLLPLLGAERGRHVGCVPVSRWTASGLRTVAGSLPAGKGDLRRGGWRGKLGP